MATREQAFLETFFVAISQFAFDKAKDLVEKEKEAYRTYVGSTWFQFLITLVPFAQAEKSYACLLFLLRRGLFGTGLGTRDSGVRAAYDSIKTELRKIEDAGRQLAGGGTSVSLEKLVSHLCGQLGHLVDARGDAMDFYERLHAVGSQRQLNIDEMLEQLTALTAAHQKSFHHPLLGPVRSSFHLEMEVLRNLLQAQLHMSRWRFLPSLLCLNDAHAKLAAWGPTLQHKEVSTFSFMGLSPRHTAAPVLYDWLRSYRATLVSKFTLYFHEVLGKQTASSEMKLLTARTSVDYHAKIVSFQRKSDAYSVSLVFDTHGAQPATFDGHGYHHPARVAQRPLGLDSFPAIFFYPPSEKPTAHWASVVRIMTDHKASELSGMDRVVSFYDRHVQTTYFMMAAEAHMTLVVIFDCKKSERDSYVTNFIVDMCGSLRGTKLFASLKPGVK
ncbi:PREDICTED: UPF0536 protein C12orf66 homolog [Priapulus caudatus]|uniref:UPF0536 protein C12orf66 homolog n=1 Tax=Priapulus caudatus TaxID=37621 RepID=A0ABM1DX27_PRICU|nr:PREDICTED: UPF0536 protein C12orf66 homolog [Priapulus caudatus]